MMHIGELAERSELSLRTLRHYDEIGLLRASGRSEGGFRLYSEDDLSRLLVIRRMKPLGFSLEQMAELLEIVDALEAEHPDASVRDVLDTYIVDAEQRRDKLARQLAMADEFVELLRSK
ncbi:MerR family transcriptional regulator [Microbacterium sp. MPKO10]|uniref:MerR family transcriptional regulator n=1 Tax=Microbacterium sp. MPKO10 TaxID=2989818 RepID=UPI002235CC43|nr:MerR family transcriptional regulator [Microbacterium sp. MPKO10]MCW4458775.1 MerR family transcriptional regulator [Microbacterium sp. MPKO10]